MKFYTSNPAHKGGLEAAQEAKRVLDTALLDSPDRLSLNLEVEVPLERLVAANRLLTEAIESLAPRSATEEYNPAVTSALLTRINIPRDGHGLSMVARVLRRTGREFYAELVQLQEEDLLEMRQVGEIGVRKLTEHLKTLGLTLGMEVPKEVMAEISEARSRVGQ